MCPFRHISGEKTVVCKHWLRGLCKKGDQCEFLHEYDMTKMPECYFYSKFETDQKLLEAEWPRMRGFLNWEWKVEKGLVLLQGDPCGWGWQRLSLRRNLHFFWILSTVASRPGFPAGECSNKECPFLHIDPESKIKDCPWYDRGFCKHGRCQDGLSLWQEASPPFSAHTLWRLPASGTFPPTCLSKT
ncbi:hypothetical protein P7K49_004055 [Saguinus oedipus]|uniref:Cleavage and polyadenylation specificity factor subunit 4 n=1 Tax=Saguinus oedipus TaxID=9490 RepID=A0ABQ9W699_SAGOE|nr:hypothetical protein P7K49_004055 [Saguinus oedipus]